MAETQRAKRTKTEFVRFNPDPKPKPKPAATSVKTTNFNINHTKSKTKKRKISDKLEIKIKKEDVEEKTEEFKPYESKPEHEIKIEECWMVHEYNHINKEAIKDKETILYGISGEIFVPYFLRFLLFCDQCHDFCETAPRNNWVYKKGAAAKQMVYDKIKDAYSIDIQYITQNINKIDNGAKTLNETEIYELGFGTSSLEADEAWMATHKIKTIIDNLFTKYFDITVGGSSATEASQGCSMAAKRLLDKIQAIPLPDNSEKWIPDTGYTIAVDADGSRFKLSTLLNFICDESLDKTKKAKVKLYDMASTKYDSASGSGAINFIKAIKANYDGVDTISIRDRPRRIPDSTNNEIFAKTKLNLTVKGISLINFTYELDKTSADKIDSKRWQNYRAKIVGDITDKNQKIIAGYLPASTKEIYDLVLAEGLIIPYKKPGSSSNKEVSRGWKKDRIIASDLNKLRERTINMNLKIHRFFKSGEDKFNELNNIITSQNSSVAKITENYDITKSKWLDKNIKPTDNVNNAFSIMCYKTMGDFGQILEYKSRIDNLKVQPRSLFITFDTICSRISSLFNKYTIFESSTREEQGVTVFLPNILKNAIDGLIKYGQTSDAASALMDLESGVHDDAMEVEEEVEEEEKEEKEEEEKEKEKGEVDAEGEEYEVYEDYEDYEDEDEDEDLEQRSKKRQRSGGGKKKGKNTIKKNKKKILKQTIKVKKGKKTKNTKKKNHAKQVKKTKTNKKN